MTGGLNLLPDRADKIAQHQNATERSDLCRAGGEQSGVWKIQYMKGKIYLEGDYCIF